MIVLPVGIQENPPLLQTYILPSGPSAAPFGPPGICATTSLRPSGWTRVSRRPRISTSTTDPSGIATGPSGNSRPVASTRTSGIDPPGGLFRSARPVAHRIFCGDVRAKRPALASSRSAWARAAKCREFRLILFLYRNPDFEAAIAGCGIEIRVIALEIRRIGNLEAGSRQPLVPDRIDAASDGRDVLAMREHGITLLRNSHPEERPRQIRK